MSFSSDLREIMSQYRDNKEAIAAAKEVLNLVDIHFAKTLASVQAKGWKSAAGAVKGEALSPVDAIADIFAAYPDPLRSDLQETAAAIGSNLEANINETLKDLRAANENGRSVEEHVVALVNHHLPELLTKHPEADADRLRKDLFTITSITQSLLLADMRGQVDRLIAAAKQERSQHALN